MSISVFNNFTSSNAAGRASCAHPSERGSAPKATMSGSTLSDIASAVVAGVGSTVTFSGKALQAAESAGGVVAHSAEDLAVGAWHALHVAAIRAEHGVTPQEFIMQRRVREAARLLKTTQMAPKLVADAVGIPNLQHFNKVMRMRTGASPRAFRAAAPALKE